MDTIPTENTAHLAENKFREQAISGNEKSSNAVPEMGNQSSVKVTKPEMTSTLVVHFSKMQMIKALKLVQNPVNQHLALITLMMPGLIVRETLIGKLLNLKNFRKLQNQTKFITINIGTSTQLGHTIAKRRFTRKSSFVRNWKVLTVQQMSLPR